MNTEPTQELTPSSRRSNNGGSSHRRMRVRLRRIILISIVIAAAAFGAMAVLNRDVDPTEWKGIRSGYENTK